MATPVRSTHRRGAACAALLASTALLLAGCGGSSDDTDSATSQTSSDTSTTASTAATPEAAVYQFDEAKTDPETPFQAVGMPVRIQISDELKAAAPEGKTVAIDHVDITAKAFDTGICREDVAITYADGVTGNKDLAGMTDGATMVDTLPEDSALEEGTIYALNDYSGYTRVRECAEDGSEDSDASDVITFTYSDAGQPGQDEVTNYIANAHIYIMAGGSRTADGATIAVDGKAGPKVDLSVDGHWTAKE